MITSDRSSHMRYACPHEARQNGLLGLQITLEVSQAFGYHALRTPALHLSTGPWQCTDKGPMSVMMQMHCAVSDDCIKGSPVHDIKCLAFW